jgi:hypothetical protein
MLGGIDILTPVIAALLFAVGMMLMLVGVVATSRMIFFDQSSRRAARVA